MLVKIVNIPQIASAIRPILALTAALFFCVSLGAQDYDFRIYFPVDVHTFCPDYLENPATLARLDSTVSAHGIEYVEKVTVVAFASPDGSQKKNLVLAARRAESMRSYLENKYPSLAGKIAVESGIEEWPEDNSELVRLRYAAFRLSFPFSLEIPVPGLDPDYIIDEDPIYALDLVEDALNIPFEPQPTVTVPPFTNIYFPKQKRPVTVAALKTNLLYDLATVYNLALEIPVWDRLSVVVEDTFPWWETSFKYCLQMWEIGGEVRYWFKSWDPKGADKLLGFFAGAYGMSSKFDFQWLNSVDYQGEYWSAGLTGGWSTTLGRRKWANLELSLGLGYLHTDWRHYLPTDVYDKLIRDKANTGSVDYWGPTRAQVSLVIPINVNVRRKEASHE